MSNYKKFIKNIPEEFGKLFDVIYNQLNQLEPEKITTIMNPETMPADFVPFVAWQLGVLYETVMNGLDPAKMYELKQLRKLEGTAAGVKAALALIPDSSFEYENTGPCLFQLKFKPEIDSVFSQKSWDYLYYLINDYKRKSAHCTLYLEREKHVDLKLAAAVRNDRVIEYPVQEREPFVWSSSILFPQSGMVLPLDTDLFFTGFSSLPSIHIYINGVSAGSAPVIDGVWSIPVNLSSDDYDYGDPLAVTAGFYSFTASVTCAVIPDPDTNPIEIECTNIIDEDVIMRRLPFDIEGTAENTDHIHAYLTQSGADPEDLEWDPNFVRYVGVSEVVSGAWKIEGYVLPDDLITGSFRLTFIAGNYKTHVEPAIGTAIMTISQPDVTIPRYSTFTTSGNTNLPERYEGLALKVYASVYVSGFVGAQKYEVGSGSVAANGSYAITCQLPDVDLVTDECIIEVQYDATYKNDKEVSIVDGTLSITTSPATAAPDTDITIAGTSTHLAGATVTIQAKKSTAGDETYATIGTAVVQEDGTWTKANAQLPSATFAPGDTANIRAVSGTVQSEVVNVTVASGSFLIDDFESYAIDSNPVGQGWIRDSTSIPTVSKVIDESGSKVWNIKWDHAWRTMGKTFSGQNFNGKSLKYRVKASFFNKVSILMRLYSSGSVVLNISSPYTIPTSWTSRSHLINYDGNIDRIEFDLYTGGFICYIDDIIIE